MRPLPLPKRTTQGFLPPQVGVAEKPMSVAGAVKIISYDVIAVPAGGKRSQTGAAAASGSSSVVTVRPS